MNKTIYIAEDDKFYAGIFKARLTKEGYDVSVFENGVEILSALKAHAPDLIVLDLVMPAKDGFAVLTELKADASLSKVPVVVLSNLGQDEDIQRATKLGAVDYMVKTNLSVSEMVEKVKANLK